MLLPDGWGENVRVDIADGRFTNIERNVGPRPHDERVALALPGMSNVHSHGFQRGMAGLSEYQGPDADNFWSWRELMYRFVARMTPEDIEAITAQAYVEMLEAGFTRVGEFHYVHHDPAGKAYANPAEMAERVSAAAHLTGMGLTLLPVFYAHGGFGGAAPHAGQRRFVTDLEAFSRLLVESRRAAASLPDAVVGVAPHSLRAVTPQQLQAILPLAPDGPIHIHAAEQQREVAECVAWSGARPVQWLLEHAPVDRRWCLVHATHMTDDEIERLAASGAVAGFCPITEANLGDGIAPAAPFLKAGGMFGIGTDSNVSIGVRDELRQLEYSQRLRDRARNVIGNDATLSTGRVLFEGAARGGSRALLGEGAGAGIATGGAADFFSLDVDAPLPAGRDRDVSLDRFIFAPGTTGVDSVWRAGIKVVSRGVHRARDDIASRCRATLVRLLRV